MNSKYGFISRSLEKYEFYELSVYKNINLLDFSYNGLIIPYFVIMLVDLATTLPNSHLLILIFTIL